MHVSVQFFGAAAYKIVTASGRHVLIGPFLDMNPYSPVKTKDLDQVDLLLLTHNAVDHSKELTVKGSATIAGEYRAVLDLTAQGPHRDQAAHQQDGALVRGAGDLRRPAQGQSLADEDRVAPVTNSR
jgi:hypothetical protein